MEIYGVPNQEIINLSSRGHLFFESNGDPILVANSRGKTRQPKTKTLKGVLGCNDRDFLDFLN